MPFLNHFKVSVAWWSKDLLLRILALIHIFLLEKISVYAPNSVTQAFANVRLQQFSDPSESQEKDGRSCGAFYNQD